MASYSGAKIIRIIPDQPGRGGSKSSLSTQSVNLDLRTAFNVFVTYGRWRRAQEAISTEPVTMGAPGFTTLPDCVESFGLHNYATFDTTNANLPPVDCLLSHDLKTDGTHVICQHNPGLNIVKTYDPMGGPDTAIPATFLNIKNRCFMCWAATNNFIYDLPHTKEYDVGIDAPLTAATYTFGGVDSGLAAAATGSNRVNWITSTTSGFSNDTKAIILDGVTYQTLQPNPLVTTFATPGDVTGTMGASTFTVNAGLWPIPKDYFGLQVRIDPGGGNEETHYILDYTIAGPDTTVTVDGTLAFNHTNDSYTLDNPPVDNTQLILSSVYTGSDSVGIAFTAYTGPLAWEPPGGTPPQYAYAYYDDPTTNTINGYGTGHVSNISPLTMVTEQNVQGVSVILNDIMDSGPEDRARFNRILIFRTIIIGGSGDVYAFDPTDPTIPFVPNDGTGPHTFEDIFDDSYLVASGPFTLAGPTNKNRKPPPSAHHAYWDGRVWINPVNDPSLIAFSGDISDIPFGVPEECYPSTYALRIPSDDGRVTGMKLVGPILVITTERYAYYVVGGPTSDQYRLRRFSTMMYGVGDYQMCEFTGQTTDDADSVLYVGKDKKVYLTAPSIGNIPMSDPVQNVFNEDITTGYANTRIADVAINGNHYIICTLENVTEVYDWERKVWYDLIVNVKNQGAVRPEAFAKIYGSAVPVQFLFIHAGAVYDWLGDNNTTGTQVSFVSTNPLMLGEKKRYLLAEVRLYVSDNSEPWGIATAVNEGGGFQWAAIPQPDPLNSLQGAFPLDSPTAEELIMVPFTQEQPVTIGYRFQITVNWPGDNVIRELYAIDAIFTPIGEDGQADQ